MWLPDGRTSYSLRQVLNVAGLVVVERASEWLVASVFGADAPDAGVMVRLRSDAHVFDWMDAVGILEPTVEFLRLRGVAPISPTNIGAVPFSSRQAVFSA